MRKLSSYSIKVTSPLIQFESNEIAMTLEKKMRSKKMSLKKNTVLVNIIKHHGKKKVTPSVFFVKCKIKKV